VVLLSRLIEAAFNRRCLTSMVLLPLPRFVLARAAHEGAFDVDVVAAAQLRDSIFAEAVPGNDALPSGL